MLHKVFATFACLSISAMAQAAPAVGYDSFKITDAAANAMDSTAYKVCMKNSGGVTVDMRNCGGAEYAKLDKRRAAALKATVARSSKATARRLQQDEKLWQASGMKHCDKRSELNEGGTLELLENDACGHEEMKRRIAWLEQYK
jgi:uncharacterized protein YecT (DUF1311 family)